MDGAARASRDGLAVVASRPAAATEAAERPALLARRDGQQAVSAARLTATASVATIIPTSTTGPTIPGRVQATIASDRALFTALTTARETIKEQADVVTAQNRASFESGRGTGVFAALLGSDYAVPGTPPEFQAARQRAKAQAAAREATHGKVTRRYAAPSQPTARHTAPRTSRQSQLDAHAAGSIGSAAPDPDALPGRSVDLYG